jgi:hypothetical protein
MMLIGYAVKLYLKWAKLDDLNKVLGVGVYFVKLYANALLIFGIIAFVTLGLSFVLHFISEWYL